MTALLQAVVVDVSLHVKMYMHVESRCAILTCGALLQLGAKDWCLWQRQTTMVDAACEFLR